MAGNKCPTNQIKVQIKANFEENGDLQYWVKNLLEQNRDPTESILEPVAGPH